MIKLKSYFTLLLLLLFELLFLRLFIIIIIIIVLLISFCLRLDVVKLLLHCYEHRYDFSDFFFLVFWYFIMYIYLLCKTDRLSYRFTVSTTVLDQFTPHITIAWFSFSKVRPNCTMITRR